MPARRRRCIARSLSAIGSVLVSITINWGRLLGPLFSRPAAAIFSTASSSAATVASDVIRTSAPRATAVVEASTRPPDFFSRWRGCGRMS
jgi:hypothetical protein